MPIPREVGNAPGGVEMVAPMGDEKEVPLSEADALRLADRYEFVQAPDDTFREWEVKSTAGTGTLILTMKHGEGPATYALVHTGKSKVISIGQGQGQSEQFNFKLTGRPGAIIRFTVSEGEVRELFFAEEKGGDMTFAVAFRQP